MDIEVAPAWVRDHFEASQYASEDRRLAEFEHRLPGALRIFDQMIDLIPSANTDKTEFPIVAAIVKPNDNGSIEVLSMKTNEVNRLNDSMAHGDRLALEEAQKKFGIKHLDGAWLFTTLQTCLMCCGSAINTQVAGVAYGVSHDEVKGRYELVDGVYKPYRTTVDLIDTDFIYTANGIEVVGGIKKAAILKKMTRTHGSLRGYYSDPEA